MGFILLSRKKELVIFVSTSFVANGIGESIVHIVLDVNN